MEQLSVSCLTIISIDEATTNISVSSGSSQAAEIESEVICDKPNDTATSRPLRGHCHCDAPPIVDPRSPTVGE